MSHTRTKALLAAAMAACIFAPMASGQISTGEEYRQAADVTRDAFGEDYDSQKRAAAEANAKRRVIGSLAAPFVKGATTALQEGDFDKANAQANLGLANQTLTDYEKGVLYQLSGQAKLRLQDYVGAKKAYEYAVNSGGLSNDEKTKVEPLLAALNKQLGG